MKNQKQKGISSLFGIIIVIVVVILAVGGVLAYQYLWLPKEIKSSITNLSNKNPESSKVITIISPSKGEKLTIGEVYQIHWTSIDVTGTVGIMLSDTNIPTASLSKVWQVENIPDTGNYSFTVPEVSPGDKYQIYISSKEKYGYSDTFSITAKDETADWQTYRNEEYGFEIKYPKEIKQDEISYNKDEGPSFENCDLSKIIDMSLLGSCYKSLAIIQFPYYWEESPFQKRPTNMNLDVPICYSRFFIQILEQPSLFSLEKAKEIFKRSEYIILSGIKGLRRNEFIGLPPGGGGDDDIVYLPKESKLYLIHLITDREITGAIGFPEDTPEKCLNHQMEIFNKMLSTFRFLE